MCKDKINESDQDQENSDNSNNTIPDYDSSSHIERIYNPEEEDSAEK